MPKFTVRIKEVHSQLIEVEAESPQAARTTAAEVLANGINQDGTDLADNTSYYGTVDRDEWDVWES